VAKEALFGRGTSGGDGDEEELNGDLHDELMVVVMMMMIKQAIVEEAMPMQLCYGE